MTAAAPHEPTRALEPAVVDAVRRSVRDVLEQSPAYLDSPAPQRKVLASKLVRLGLAGAKLLQDEQRETERIEAPLAAAQAADDPAPLASAQSAGDQTDFKAAKTAGDTFKAIREAIDFPNYVSSLISGVFQAITQASIKQVEGLISLLDHVSSPAEDFANAEVKDDDAARWAAQRFSFLSLTDDGLAMSGEASLAEHRDAIRGALAATDREVAALDEGDLAGTLLPLVRRKLGRDRQAMLGTLIQLGLQRVVVDEGRLHASMDMRVDTRSIAQQDVQDQHKLDVRARARANMSAGVWGASASLATNYAMIHSDNRSTKEELDTRAGLRSSVDLAFRTEQVPLDRLADEKARVRLNNVARVPVADVTEKSILDTSQPAAKPAAAAPAAAAPAAPAPRPAAAPAPKPAAAPAPKPAEKPAEKPAAKPAEAPAEQGKGG